MPTDLQWLKIQPTPIDDIDYHIDLVQDIYQKVKFDNLKTKSENILYTDVNLYPINEYVKNSSYEFP